ncbi:alpha/beta hydrolase [Kribbella qitaiheensis]|uniref:alpha/beta hydrolase n=1 Tax=Kribbella qitaiheensis TaxID=1544730 RepID=UPI003618902D
MITTYEYGEAGPRVLLLHGGGGNADQWQEFAKHLDGFRLTAVDLPGHGGSSDSSWQWDEVLDELESLDLGNPFVVGHSLGGMLAVRWGRRHPECPGVVNLDGNGWPTKYPGLVEVEPAREKLNEVFKAQADAMAAPLTPEIEEMLVTQQPYLRRNLVRRNGQIFLRPERPALDVIRELIAAPNARPTCTTVCAARRSPSSPPDCSPLRNSSPTCSAPSSAVSSRTCAAGRSRTRAVAGWSSSTGRTGCSSRTRPEWRRWSGSS